LTKPSAKLLHMRDAAQSKRNTEQVQSIHASVKRIGRSANGTRDSRDRWWYHIHLVKI